MGGLLEGKTILVTGIITDSSIAFHGAANFRRHRRDDCVQTLGAIECDARNAAGLRRGAKVRKASDATHCLSFAVSSQLR